MNVSPNLAGWKVVLLFCAMTCLAQAATRFNDGAGGNSNIKDKANWSNGLPDVAGNRGTVPKGLTTTYVNYGVDGKDITWQSGSAMAGRGELRMNNNVVTLESDSKWSSGNVYAGRDKIGATTINVMDGSSWASTRLQLGRESDAFLNQHGGSVAIDGRLLLGELKKGSQYHMHKGTLAVAGELEVRRGDLHLFGGTIIAGQLIFKGEGVLNFDKSQPAVPSALILRGDVTKEIVVALTAGRILIDRSPATHGDFDRFDYDKTIPGHTTLSRGSKTAKIRKPDVVFKPRTPARSTGRKPGPTRPARPSSGERDVENLRLAIQDLTATHGEKYTSRGDFAERLKRLTQIGSKDPSYQEKFTALKREALLANPLLDDARIVMIRRHLAPGKARLIERNGSNLGLPFRNTYSNEVTSIDEKGGAIGVIHNYEDDRGRGWNNEIAVLSGLRGTPRFTTVYRPKKKVILQDLELNVDADRLMFCSVGTHGRFHIFETAVDGKSAKQLTPADLPDVDHFDPCYLPDGRIVFTSTAAFQGLPCENGKHPMSSLYRANADGSGIRQLTFDQDSDWCPTVLANGRLMYLRYEYTDLPHYFSRVLFHSNPDGTKAMAMYGSNSYWPNSFFHARPIPDHHSKVVGIATGHHGQSRMGKMILLDTSLGRHEADGVVQAIPGRGEKVEPIIQDSLYGGKFPMAMYPYPLSDKYFLAVMKRSRDSLFGLYLVDAFDNMVLLVENEDEFFADPILLKPRPRPPVIPDKFRPGQNEGTVYLADIYRGPGLKGVPRGEVKRLRVFSYHYAHINRGGHNSCGTEAGWDIKRILGTVPVESDGSATFRIPSLTPIAIQPLDKDGAALQIMRSWFVAMPGEVVSCVGCHEDQNSVVPSRQTLAARRPPQEITPFYGPRRPYAFKTEVQPILDRYCVGCHTKDGKTRADGTPVPNFAGDGYKAFHPYVRRQGPEGDIHLTRPTDWHASTSEVVQRLRAGHHGVKLDRASWEKLYTWIDLNAPNRGAWDPPEWRGQDQARRRAELAKLYMGAADDPEEEYRTFLTSLEEQGPIETIMPEEKKETVEVPKLAGWPFSEVEAEKKVERFVRDDLPETLTLDLGERVVMPMRLIPPGKYVMGDPTGPPDAPCSIVEIHKPFYLGETEVSNSQYARFDPTHDSRCLDAAGKDQCSPGHRANDPRQPVLRVSQTDALAFCRWLSKKAGREVSLPSEQQWEWACRAGTDTPLWFGGLDADFSSKANLADGSPGRVNPFPRITKIKDGSYAPWGVGTKKPNRWGLRDMHGNVAEWTASDYDGDRKVVRGGSWRDRPERATSAIRIPYRPYQVNPMTGFRVMIGQR